MNSTFITANRMNSTMVRGLLQYYTIDEKNLVLQYRALVRPDYFKIMIYCFF